MELKPGRLASSWPLFQSALLKVKRYYRFCLKNSALIHAFSLQFFSVPLNSFFDLYYISHPSLSQLAIIYRSITYIKILLHLSFTAIYVMFAVPHMPHCWPESNKVFVLFCSVLISFPVFLFQFLFCYILERKDKKWFKRDIIVLISFLVNIGKEMSLPGSVP